MLLDQRGAGRSTPAGGLRDNTTWHLVDDLEVIRERLGIGSWLVFGGSWGRRLHGPDAEAARACAAAWGRWEAVNCSLRPDPDLLAHLTGDDTALPIARILSHYVMHGGFLASETQLLDGVDRIRHLPAVLIQCRYDLCCPPVTAYDLARRWPEAELRSVPDAGHSAVEPGVTRELLRATGRFADLLSA